MMLKTCYQFHVFIFDFSLEENRRQNKALLFQMPELFLKKSFMFTLFSKVPNGDLSL